MSFTASTALSPLPYCLTRCSIVPTVLVKDMMESSFLRLVVVGLTYEVLLILATWLFAIGKEEKKVVIQYLSKYVGKNLGK